jgi:hypothetical protein
MLMGKDAVRLFCSDGCRLGLTNSEFLTEDD